MGSQRRAWSRDQWAGENAARLERDDASTAQDAGCAIESWNLTEWAGVSLDGRRAIARMIDGADLVAGPSGMGVAGGGGQPWAMTDLGRPVTVPRPADDLEGAGS